MTPAAATLSRARKQPFNLEATALDPDWRVGLSWPLPQSEMRSAVAGPAHRLMDYLPTLPAVDRDIVLLAMPRFLPATRYGLEIALCLQAADRADMAFAGEDSTARRLRGDHADTPAFSSGGGATVSLPRRALLRRVARTASWTPPHRMPTALLAPKATAISHNGLLLNEARRRRGSLRFHQAESFVLAGRRTGSPSGVPPGALPDAAAIVDVLCREPALETGYASELRRLIAGTVSQAIASAAGDLAGLSRLPKLPEEIWSGTGGQWASRAVGLAVLARGGRAVRFDHGGTTVMARDPQHLALVEAAVSSTYVLPTQTASDQVSGGAFGDTQNLRECTLAGAEGDRHFRSVPRTSVRSYSVAGSTARPRVVYAPTILRGARQFHNGLLPDPVYLDWQLRVAEHLMDSPVDLLCKPHPEGLLRGQPHPLRRVAPTSDRRFEDEMAEADVFLIDHAESTTFWTALCGDKPVVLLDLGTWQAAPPVDAALAARAHVLTVRFDERNLPIIPPNLPDLLRQVAGQRADPGFFRALLAGD